MNADDPSKPTHAVGDHMAQLTAAIELARRMQTMKADQLAKLSDAIRAQMPDLSKVPHALAALADLQIRIPEEPLPLAPPIALHHVAWEGKKP